MANFPLTNFHFKVDWGGSNVANFTEVSGLEAEHDVIEYRSGGSPEFQILEMPGLKKYSRITLTRGVFKGDNDFFKWLNTVDIDNPEQYRRDLTISLLNANHTPIITWKVRGAWPVKMTSPEMKATESGVAIETLEISHLGFKP
jgi:phage tail-like protein